MACGSCGQKAGANVEFLAKANNGKTFTGSNTEARLFLATNGGGTVKAVPKKTLT